LGALTISQLYAVAFVSGVLTVFFDVAYQSYLPVLVTRDELVEGNAKLAVTDSAATVVGPSVAGALIDLVGASLAVIADAVSFGVSALSLLFVHTREPARRRTEGQHRPSMRSEIAEGMGYVWRHRLLRPIAASTATSNLFSSMGLAVLTLYMVRKLGMSPGLIGLTLALGNIGFVVGAVIAARVTARTGVGRMIVASMAIAGFGSLLLPLASRAVPLPWLVVGSFLFSLGSPLYNINQVSLRQAITPMRLQGRMNASMRFMVWGTMPIGSVLGGLLGTALGLRWTLVIAGIGGSTAFLWLLFSPVPTVTEIPLTSPAMDGRVESHETTLERAGGGDPTGVPPAVSEPQNAASEASSFQEGDGPTPGVGGVVGTVSGTIGIVDESVLGARVANGDDVR
jgi:MFS family permease